MRGALVVNSGSFALAAKISLSILGILSIRSAASLYL